MHQWYFLIGQQEYGPLDFDQLLQMAAAGQLPAQAYVRFGDQNWVPAMSMPQLAMIFGQQVPVPPAPVAVAAPVPRPAPMPRPAPQSHVAPGRPTVAVPVTAAAVRPAAMPVPPPPPVAPGVPAGVPVGMPMGQPVGVPMGVPMGQPVAPPLGVPLGQPVGFAPAMPTVVVNPAGKTSAQTAGKPADGTKPQKKDSGKLMLYGLGGCVVACAVVGLLIVFNSGRKTKEIAQKPAENTEITADEPTDVPEIPSSTPTVKPAVATKVVPPVTPAPTPVAESAELAAIKSSKNKWNDAAAARISMFRGMAKIEIIGVWLASDAMGTRVKKSSSPAEPAKPQAGDEPAATDEETEEPKTLATGSDSSTTNTPKYVFVEIQVTNDSPQLLKYRSWNGAASETRAILACDSTEVLAPVATTQTPAAKRHAAGVDLASKQSIRDIMVFAAPAGDFEKLQLLLPKPALALGTGYSAWLIPKDLLYLEPAVGSTAGQPSGSGTANPSVTSSGPPVSKERSEFDSLLKDINKVNAPDRPGRPVTTKDETEKPEMKKEEMPEDAKPETKPEPKPEPNKEGPPSIKDLDKAIKEANEGKPKTTTEDKPGAA